MLVSPITSFFLAEHLDGFGDTSLGLELCRGVFAPTPRVILERRGRSRWKEKSEGVGWAGGSLRRVEVVLTAHVLPLPNNFVTGTSFTNACLGVIFFPGRFC